jgi:uracil-DNA glycosylase family 4
MKRTFVPPSGNRQAKLGGCGEQPGLHEIRARPPKPFVGPSGRGLDDCFLMTKILRRDLYLTNVIKDLDKPLRHYINISPQGKATVHPEGYQYIQELADELGKLNLNCIVAFGNIPLFALTNRIGITKWRGSVLESTIVPGLKVVPTFHPATFIPPKFNFLNKPLICEDLLRAKYESGFPEIRRRERNIIIRPVFGQSIDALNYCYEVGLRGQTIALDIEVVNEEVDCISLGWSGTEAISIPFRDQQGDYFTVDQELEIMLLVAKIIQEKRIAKVGANFIFDMQFLFHKYGIRPRGINHCTQIAQKISYPDFSAGLAFVTTMYTDIPYYKEDGKQWMKMQAGTWEEWWNYNGMDSIVPVEAIPKQMQVLRKQGNEAVYERHRRLQEPLIYMSERGIRIDVEGMIEYRNEQQCTLDKTAEKLDSEIGYDINYNSPQQLMNYFYTECGIKPYKKKNQKGQYVTTTDVDALKRIVRLDVRGSKAARIMLDIRSLSKRISTYLNVGKVDKDGRYRSSYKPVGAETGRLSSGETIFGTGGNQQNWPHDLLRFFLFDEGYIGYSFDLSQIENRIVAYVGGVIPQIEAFEQGVDLHRLTASVIFDKPYNEISTEDGSSDLGDGRQSERFWGKKGNLGRTRLFLGPIIPSPPNVPKGACLNTYREAYAQLPQSTCADKINEQGIDFIYYNQHAFRCVELLAQIHDSIVFQISLREPLYRHAEILLLIKQSLEQPLYWHDTEIKTPCDLSIGFNMCKDNMVEIKSKNIPTNIHLLADKLKEVVGSKYDRQ